jgi:hypothetical protein
VQGGALLNERCKKRAMRKTLGRTSMETLPGQQKRPDVSAEQRALNALVKLIRKLRWMGMEKEAVGAEMQLALRRARHANSVLALPHNTD